MANEKYMLAAVKVAKEQLEIKQVPLPKIIDGFCLVKVKACAICGSDTWWLEDGSEDIIRGHEISGIVEAVGDGVSRWKPGDAVVIYSVIGCGKCGFCARGMETYCLNRKACVGFSKGIGENFIGGGFCEYILIPEDYLLPLPAHYDFVVGSLLTDTLGAPLRALRRSNLKVGAIVAVWGLGPLGLVAIQGAKALGAAEVIGVDIYANRINLAYQLGADVVVNPKENNPVEAIKELTKGLGADCAINTVAKDDVAQMAYESLRLDGTVALLVGAPRACGQTEWRITGSWYFTRPEYKPNLELVDLGLIKLKPIITHVLSLKDINQAFEVRFKQPQASIKVVVSI